MSDAVTVDRFLQGMTAQEYVAQMRVNQAGFARALGAVTITPAHREVLARFPSLRRVLVITEDWCGTSLMHVPFAVKLAESGAGVELRIFLRDENPDLMDRYLKRGRYRSIPVIVFFDEHMTELARFIEERPA